MKFSCIVLVALAACVQQATSYVQSDSSIFRYGGEDGLYNRDGGFGGNKMSGGALRRRENFYANPLYKYYTAGYGRHQVSNGFTDGGNMQAFRNLRRENLRVQPLFAARYDVQPMMVDNMYLGGRFLDNDNERMGNVAGMDAFDRSLNGNSAVERMIVYSSSDDDRDGRNVRSNAGAGYGVEGYNARFGGRNNGAAVALGRNYFDVYGKGRNMADNEELSIYVVDREDRENSLVDGRRNDAIFNSMAQNNEMEQFNRDGDVEEDDVTIIVPTVNERESAMARQNMGSYNVRSNVDGFNGGYGTRRNVVYFGHSNDAEQAIRGDMDDEVSGGVSGYLSGVNARETGVARQSLGGYGLRSNVEGVTGSFGNRRNHAVVYGGHNNGLNHYNRGFYGVGRRDFDGSGYNAGHNGGNTFSSVIVRRGFGGNGRSMTGNGYGMDFDGENSNSGYGYRTAYNGYRMGGYGSGFMGSSYPVSRLGSSLTSGIWNIVRGVGL